MDTVAMINATAGNNGYIGTLNGRSISGSDFLNRKNEIIEIIYSESAPKHAMVMISPVFPVMRATIPINILNMRAAAGV